MQAIEHAKAAKIETDVTEFLSKRFGARTGAAMAEVHKAEEGRPVETLWDASTAATAYARSVRWQDARVDIERKAGELIELASK